MGDGFTFLLAGAAGLTLFGFVLLIMGGFHWANLGASVALTVGLYVLMRESGSGR